MSIVQYRVLENYDSTKDYGIKITKGERAFLEKLNKGQVFRPKEFTLQNKITKASSSSRSNQIQVYKSLAVAKKIGLLQPVQSNFTFTDFLKLKSVNYFKEQISSDRHKHNKNTLSNTQKNYLRQIYVFSNWLTGRECTLSTMTQTGLDTFKKIQKTLRLENVEHFLKLYQDSTGQSEFVKIIKQYLMDDIHKNKKANTMKIYESTIKEYFAKNDSPINFKFDPKAKYDSEESVKSLSLEDLLNMLSNGQPSIIQKSVILIKFQMGSDNSTFCDRFNYEGWAQLVHWFGTEDYDKWDLSKCPVPIKLTRMKTGYPYTGFIDTDGITSLQKYLKYRQSKFKKSMSVDEPIFLNSKGIPIKELWIRDSFFRMAKTSGILKSLGGNTRNAYNLDSHELRDLLKSTLIDSGVRPDVTDHLIGHKPKDSYEKQNILYPENLRSEYMKASKRLNLFSRVSKYLKDNEEKSALLERQLIIMKTEKDDKINDLESRIKKMEMSRERREVEGITMVKLEKNPKMISRLYVCEHMPKYGRFEYEGYNGLTEIYEICEDCRNNFGVFRTGIKNMEIFKQELKFKQEQKSLKGNKV